MAMRSLTNSLTGWLIPVVAAMAAAPCAEAAVAISNKPTSNMSCSAGVCVSTAKNAVLNVTDLQGMLASSAVKVVAKAKASDIKIVASLSWPSAHRLTLVAYGSIAVQKAVTVTGPGGLTIDGTSFTLVGDIQSLAADTAVNHTGAYPLANNYDAGVDGTYATVPIPTSFWGTFEGLGNAISNLSINDSTDNIVALFADLNQNAQVRDLSVLNANVVAANGSAAVLAGGLDNGKVSYVTVSGTINAGGGLVFESLAAGSIDNCHAAVEVLSGGGGLAVNTYGPISHSDASGNVSGGVRSRVGGLVAFAQ